MSFVQNSLAAALCALLPVWGGAAFADPDLARGEKEFGRCLSCHSVVKDDQVLRKGGKTGPNLYGIIGRPAAAEDFAYADGLKVAGAKGLVWDEANLTEFVRDPVAFVKSYTGQSVRTKMTFKMKGAEHVAAYLASLVAKD